MPISRSTQGFLPSLVLVFLGVLFAVGTVYARDYYFDARLGVDDTEGTEAQPFRSIDRANAETLQPGDRLLFKGGQTFAGNLLITEGSGGAPGAPIIIGSTGDERATINAGDGTGIWIHNAGWVEVQDLNIEGSGPDQNVGTGVRFENTHYNNVKLEHVRITRVTCRGFAGNHKGLWLPFGGPSNFGEGIFVGGRPYDRSKSGYTDVRIEECETTENEHYGIHVSGAWNMMTSEFANADVAIINCLSHHNMGDPKFRANHSGNGILLEDTDGGLIESCKAWENGAKCNSTAGGPVGIWTAAANAVTIRNCESFANRTACVDGAGFDLDGGVSNSIIENCYSHDNEGAGILLYSYEGAPHYFGGNIVRNNLAVNDGRKNGMAGISVGRHGGRFEGVEITGNRVFTSKWAGAGPAVSIFGTGAANARFTNNVFIACDGAKLVEGLTQPGLIFSGNAFSTAGTEFSISLDGTAYSTLADFREQTGQESMEGEELVLTAAEDWTG